MITLPLFPLGLIEYVGGVVVIILTFMAWRYSRRLMKEDPENALWLFLNWLSIAFVIFSVSHLGRILYTFFGTCQVPTRPFLHKIGIYFTFFPTSDNMP